MFLQEQGLPLGKGGSFLKNVYNVTDLHCDDEPACCAWMLVLKGTKRFYLIPSSHRDEVEKNWIDRGPVFISQDKVDQARKMFEGFQEIVLNEGDLLVFPGFWYHEVHNLTPDTIAVTNGLAWPSSEEPSLK